MSKYQESFETKGQFFLLRNAEENDAQKMFEFMRHVDGETTFLAREPGEFEASFSLESEAALLKSWSAGEDKLFLVAETKSGEIAATCGCTRNSGRRRTRHLAEIAVSVRQDFWRMGLGRRLFQIQCDWCRQKEIEKLCLTVDTENLRALGLYLSLGFVVEGTLKQQAKMSDGSYRDLYTMGKFFR